MKKISQILIMLVSLCKVQAQVVITPQVISSGLVSKEQIWNVLLTNNGSAYSNVYMEISLVDQGSNLGVLTATSNHFALSTGATTINTSLISPIQYNILNTLYGIDASPSGFLPFGHFIIYYSLYNDAESDDKLAEASLSMDIEPLSPPILVDPPNGDSINTVIPQFSWLDPMPTNLFVNLQYDIDVAEILSTQSAADAIQQNFPLWHYEGLLANSVLYPISSPALSVGKKYAWRISARSMNQIVARSEVWQYYIKNDSAFRESYVFSQPFMKLKKEHDEAYSLNSATLNYEYLNEINDTSASIQIFDLTSVQRQPLNLPSEIQVLHLGQNFIKYDLSKVTGMQQNHIYLFELINSKQEQWYLKFEYLVSNQ